MKPSSIAERRATVDSAKATVEMICQSDLQEAMPELSSTETRLIHDWISKQDEPLRRMGGLRRLVEIVLEQKSAK
jgi:hypothetical protein